MWFKKTANKQRPGKGLYEKKNNFVNDTRYGIINTDWMYQDRQRY